jgi:hypothetical protein
MHIFFHLWGGSLTYHSGAGLQWEGKRSRRKRCYNWFSAPLEDLPCTWGDTSLCSESEGWGRGCGRLIILNTPGCRGLVHFPSGSCFLKRVENWPKLECKASCQGTVGRSGCNTQRAHSSHSQWGSSPGAGWGESRVQGKEWAQCSSSRFPVGQRLSTLLFEMPSTASTLGTFSAQVGRQSQDPKVVRE